MTEIPVDYPWVIEIWSLDIIWNLGFGDWDFRLGPSGWHILTNSSIVTRTYFFSLVILLFSSSLISRLRSFPTFDLGSISLNSMY